MDMEDIEGRLKDLEKDHLVCSKWQAEHDGRINAWWEAQHAWNARVDSSVQALERTAWKSVGIGATILAVINLLGYYFVQHKGG